MRLSLEDSRKNFYRTLLKFLFLGRPLNLGNIYKETSTRFIIYLGNIYKILSLLKTFNKYTRISVDKKILW